MKNKVLVGTRKGLLVLEKADNKWKITGDHFMGIPVNMVFENEYNGDWWVALDHGHWGNKLQRSADHGETWEEIPAPVYPEGTFVKEDVPASLRYIWAFSPVTSEDGDQLWIGTEPGGLFKREPDGSMSFVESLWNHPSRPDHWFGGGRDYAGIHSIVVDPRDEDHIYLGVSVAGVFESNDGGSSWTGKNNGLRAEFLPNPDAEYGHDPHLLVHCRSSPDVLWQQNHCGIFRSADAGTTWQDISDKKGQANFGFAIAADAENDQRAWVVPAISDEVRMAIDKRLCVCRTDDGGKSWNTFRNGLPQEYCFDIVYRHALIAQGSEVFFGTTTGNLFYSSDAGENWESISNYLPMVYGLAFAS
ncbi:MAG: glycosyl hydrolase [Saprospiraceae bacterium]|nr:glycosyl hydrolase [Saprospiraceae bacterium]